MAPGGGSGGHRPDFEKLVIGPLMVLGEMTTGGHYMEMVKIIKQAKGLSYPTIMKDLWVNEGWLGFYKGFLPWGMIQMVKGVPVLFIQSECDVIFKKWGLDRQTSETLAGVAGGVGQGFFITPTQRLKTIVMTDPKYGGSGAAKSVGQALRTSAVVAVDIVKTEGVGTLFKGLGPMMVKRGFDWGFRFWGVAVAKDFVQKGDPKRPLSVAERLMIGFFGGAVSTLTMPLDSLVANCQKASKAEPGKKVNAMTVAKDMWKQGGYEPFVRGWTMRLMHAGYHTMWMTTIGQMLFDFWKASQQKK